MFRGLSINSFLEIILKNLLEVNLVLVHWDVGWGI